MSDTTRCFVALDLPVTNKRAIAALVQDLAGLDFNYRLNWVRPDGLHLTLKFLGEVPNEQLADIETTCRTVAATLEPFTLSIGGLGFFPTADAPRIVWLGLDGDLPALHVAQKSVEASLAELGFAPENRPYAPHLTLARVPDIGPSAKKQLGQLLTSYQGRTDFGSFTSTELVLMHSQLSSGGAIYTPLQHFHFGKKDTQS